MTSRIDRKDLLRKSQKDLLKECKKHNISTKGITNKSEMIDLIIMNHSNPTRKKLKKKKMTRYRSKSIADTLLMKSSKKKILHKRTESATNNTNKNNKRELKIDSLLRLKSLKTMDLNESTETTIETKIDKLFLQHLNISDIQNLKVNDYVDFRANNGYVFGAIITNKNENILTVNFKNNIGRSENISCDYNKEIFRFAKYKTISQRKTHKSNMNSLQIGNIVDINIKHITNNEWIIGEIVNKDFKSGQYQVQFSHNKRKYLYWIHSDNINEIAPYLTHYDINKNIGKYLNEIDYKSDDNINNNNDCIDYNTLKNKLELYINDKNKLVEINTILEHKNNEYEIEINKLKQRLYIQQEEIMFLKSEKDNKKNIKKKCVKKNKNNKNKKSKLFKSFESVTPRNNKSKSSWKSRNHAFQSKTPKNNKIGNVSTKNKCKLNKLNKNDKNKNKNKSKKKLKKQESLRYDESFVFKIKGLSALDLFVQEYETKKNKENEIEEKTQIIHENYQYDNDDNDDEQNDLSTDDDFDDQ